MKAGVVLMAALVVSAAAEARGEFRESAVGVEGGVALPALSSADATAFRLVTFGVGGFGRYGVLTDLDLELRFDFSLFSGRVDETRDLQRRDLVGVRYFRAEQYHASIGGRYKLVSGYFLAPYVEGHVGLLWLVLREQQFLSPAGESFGLDVGDEGQGAVTLTAGLAVDYRLFDLGTVGLAVRWVELVGGGIHQRYLSIPLQVALYW